MSGLGRLGRYLTLGLTGLSLYATASAQKPQSDTLSAGDYKFLRSELDMLQEMAGAKNGTITVLSETKSGGFQCYKENGYNPVTDYRKFRPFLKKSDRDKDYIVTPKELREYYRKFMKAKIKI